MPYELIDEVPVKTKQEKWGELRAALRSAPDGKWVVVPNDSKHPVSYFATMISQALRTGVFRDPLKITTRSDRDKNCVYVRELRGEEAKK